MISINPVAFDKSISSSKLMQLEEAITAKELKRKLLLKNCNTGHNNSGTYPNNSPNYPMILMTYLQIYSFIT
jgi:hypothetical protein